MTSAPDSSRLEAVSRNRANLGVSLSLLVLVLAAFHPLLSYDFVRCDDPLYVTGNARVQEGLTLANLGWAFGNLDAGFWQPLTWLSYMLDMEVFGLNGGGFHLTNLLLHAAATVVLFLALQSLTGARWRSAFVAALFGLHPLHVESVAWISERKDVLSGLFWMLALWFYAKYARAKTGNAATPAVRKFYVATLLCFIAGLMSKTIVVTLPAILLLLDAWPLGRLAWGAPDFRRRLGQLFVEKIPFFIAGLASAWITFRGSAALEAVQSTTRFPIGTRIANAIHSCVQYLWQTFWPADLAFFYPYPESFPAPFIILGALLLAVVSVSALLNFRRRPYFAVGWFWFLIALTPVIGLIQVGSHSRADRYTYLSLIGVFMVVAWAASDSVARWRGRKWALSAAGAAIVGACLLLSRQQLVHWRSSEALYARALQVTENNWFAHAGIGGLLLQQDKPAEARTHFERAVALKPNYQPAHVGLGASLLMENRIPEAVARFEEALRVKPSDPVPLYYLGVIQERRGAPDLAIQRYREAVTLQPRYLEAHQALGGALLNAGRLDEAITHLQQAAVLAPRQPDIHFNLALALKRAGRPAEAIAHYQEAIRLRPEFPDAHNNLGLTLLSLNRFSEAVASFERAVQLRPGDPGTHNNLGVALYQSGDLERAHAAFRETLRLNPDHAGARRNLEALLEEQAAHRTPPPGQ